MDKQVILAKSIFAVAMFLTAGGCASGPTVKYGDATAVTTISTDFSSTDLQTVAATMVDSLLMFPPIMVVTKERRPVLLVESIKNKSLQHMDTESITDTIRAKLIRSGKFRFIDRTTDDAAMNEIKTQQHSGLVDKNNAVARGKQFGAEYILTGNVSEIQQSKGRITDVYYKFTLNLKNLTTGILEWSDEKEIRKVAQRGIFGG